MKYRAEIDGLRAVAVLPVVFYHAGYNAFAGGFVGVDVFFVISGYLITTIISKEIVEEGFSIIGFYERRARRILPALVVMIVLCVPFAVAWMLPVELKDFSQSVAAASGFASNFLFWKEAGYFTEASELKPLIHTWSLAIEEQYYILIPLVLAGLYYLSASRLVLFLVILSLTFISLILSVWYTPIDANSSFYLLPFRFWELGIGSLLALVPNALSKWEVRFCHLFSVIGLAMIVGAIALFDDLTPFPSFTALLPCLGTALVIRYAIPKTGVNFLLSIKPMVGIGLVSYSFYLFHQPAFAFARLRDFSGVSGFEYAGLIAFSGILAFLSWKYVEVPFRNRNRISARLVFGWAASSLIILLSIGVGGAFLNGLPNRLPVEASTYISEARDLNPTGRNCMSRPGNVIDHYDSCVHGDQENAVVALWGDSHAMAISTALGQQLQSQGAGVRDFTYVSCPPSQNLVVIGFEATCHRHNQEVLSSLLEDYSTQYVVLFARWSLYFEGERFSNGEGATESGPPGPAIDARSHVSILSESARIRAIEHDITVTVQSLLAAGKTVLVVFSTPEPGWHVPYRLARASLIGTPFSEEISTDRRLHLARDQYMRALVEQWPPSDLLLIVDPLDVFCTELRCRHTLELAPLFADDDHLNSLGARMLAEKIVSTLRL